MAYVVATKPGRFEIRESRSTPKGPRSRTLANFGELTDEVIAKARARAEKPPAVEELQEMAVRAGARVRGTEMNEAARQTLRRLASGERLDPMLRRLLLGALREGRQGDRPADPDAAISDAARSALEWIGVGPEERARTLRDLLGLADALPIRLRPHEIEFPRLSSA